MRTDRLLKLAELLEADAANPKGIKFDLSGWAKPADKHWASYDQYDEGTEIIPVDCGTSACALGLAAISGAFKDDGLSWEITPTGSLIPIFGEGANKLMAFTAAEALFELNHEQCLQLFDPDYYPRMKRKGVTGELAVATRIHTLVTDGNLNVEETDD